ncbi:hypothetical protein OH77DRAFT_1446921, partial [Trametes cingulata]
ARHAQGAQTTTLLVFSPPSPSSWSSIHESTDAEDTLARSSALDESPARPGRKQQTALERRRAPKAPPYLHLDHGDLPTIESVVRCSRRGPA